MSQMPVRGYLLCSIERTGSNLIADGLRGTGVAGLPAEYFNPSEQTKPWMRGILGDDGIRSGLPKILMAGTTKNGLFGAKLHWGHMNFFGKSVTDEVDRAPQTVAQQSLKSQLRDKTFADALALLRRWSVKMGPPGNAYALLQTFLPDLRCIRLTRRNMVARAVSYVRARQTGRWYQSLSDNPPPAEPSPEFDFAEIHVSHCLGCLHDELWAQFFRQLDISPYCVAYEDLVTDYNATMREILQFLDLADVVDAVPPPVSAKQSDSLSEEWERRYRAKIGWP